MRLGNLHSERRLYQVVRLRRTTLISSFGDRWFGRRVVSASSCPDRVGLGRFGLRTD